MSVTLSHRTQDSLAMAPVELKKEMYGDMLRELAARTGRLVAQWDTVRWALACATNASAARHALPLSAFRAVPQVGFCHGVLNTDNMSVTGLTLDYGPFAFLNYYDPDFVSSGSDDTGRYAFGRQRERCAFNLSQLAVAVQPITGTLSLATIFTEEFLRQRHALFLRKLGLLDADVAKAVRMLCRRRVARERRGMGVADGCNEDRRACCCVAEQGGRREAHR